MSDNKITSRVETFLIKDIKASGFSKAYVSDMNGVGVNSYLSVGKIGEINLEKVLVSAIDEDGFYALFLYKHDSGENVSLSPNYIEKEFEQTEKGGLNAPVKIVDAVNPVLSAGVSSANRLYVDNTGLTQPVSGYVNATVTNPVSAISVLNTPNVTVTNPVSSVSILGVSNVNVVNTAAVSGHVSLLGTSAVSGNINATILNPTTSVTAFVSNPVSSVFVSNNPGVTILNPTTLVSAFVTNPVSSVSISGTSLVSGSVNATVTNAVSSVSILGTAAVSGSVTVLNPTTNVSATILNPTTSLTATLTNPVSAVSITNNPSVTVLNPTSSVTALVSNPVSAVAILGTSSISGGVTVLNPVSSVSATLTNPVSAVSIVNNPNVTVLNPVNSVTAFITNPISAVSLIGVSPVSGNVNATILNPTTLVSATLTNPVSSVSVTGNVNTTILNPTTSVTALISNPVSSVNILGTTAISGSVTVLNPVSNVTATLTNPVSAVNILNNPGVTVLNPVNSVSAFVINPTNSVTSFISNAVSSVSIVGTTSVSGSLTLLNPTTSVTATLTNPVSAVSVLNTVGVSGSVNATILNPTNSVTAFVSNPVSAVAITNIPNVTVTNPVSSVNIVNSPSVTVLNPVNSVSATLTNPVSAVSVVNTHGVSGTVSVGNTVSVSGSVNATILNPVTSVSSFITNPVTSVLISGNVGATVLNPTTLVTSFVSNPVSSVSIANNVTLGPGGNNGANIIGSVYVAGLTSDGSGGIFTTVHNPLPSGANNIGSVNVANTVAVSGNVSVLGTVPITGTVQLSGVGTSVGNPLYVSQAYSTMPVSGTITTTDTVLPAPSMTGSFLSGTPTPNSYVIAPVLSGASTLNFQINGLTSGNLYFEYSLDSTNGINGNWSTFTARCSNTGGTVYSTVANINGDWIANCAGFNWVRIRSSGTLSGTPTVLLGFTSGVNGLVITGSLPQGGNNIGSVNVNTLPSIPAGTNTIGNVNVNGIVPVSGSLTVNNPVTSIGIAQSISLPVYEDQIPTRKHFTLTYDTGTTGTFLTEALLNMTPNIDFTTASASSIFAVPAGYTLKVVNITVGYLVTSSTGSYANVRLRGVSASGGALSVTSPVLWNTVMGSPTGYGSDSIDRAVVPMNLEFPSGTKLGFSVKTSASLNTILTISVNGFLY